MALRGERRRGSRHPPGNRPFEGRSMKTFTLTRRQCVAGLAGAALMPWGMASPNAARAHDWPAVQAALDGFVTEGKAAGVAVAISFGDGRPSYPAAGTLAFDSPAPFDENSLV